MKKIEIDGKTYVPIEELDTKSKGNKFSIKKHSMLMDAANVMAMGSCNMTGDWVETKIDFNYLESIIKAFKVLGIKESISLVWSKDLPVGIGRVNDEGSFNGIILAPRVESE